VLDLSVPDSGWADGTGEQPQREVNVSLKRFSGDLVT
jgi:hypothetical protein